MPLNKNILGLSIYESLKETTTIYSIDPDNGEITSSVQTVYPLPLDKCKALANSIIEHIKSNGEVSVLVDIGQVCTYSGTHPPSQSSGSIS